jgi:hypothetical protein
MSYEEEDTWALAHRTEHLVYLSAALYLLRKLSAVFRAEHFLFRQHLPLQTCGCNGCKRLNEPKRR